MSDFIRSFIKFLGQAVILVTSFKKKYQVHFIHLAVLMLANKSGKVALPINSCWWIHGLTNNKAKASSCWTIRKPTMHSSKQRNLKRKPHNVCTLRLQQSPFHYYYRLHDVETNWVATLKKCILWLALLAHDGTFLPITHHILPTTGCSKIIWNLTVIFETHWWGESYFYFSHNHLETRWGRKNAYISLAKTSVAPNMPWWTGPEQTSSLSSSKYLHIYDKKCICVSCLFCVCAGLGYLASKAVDFGIRFLWEIPRASLHCAQTTRLRSQPLKVHLCTRMRTRLVALSLIFPGQKLHCAHNGIFWFVHDWVS